MDRKITIELDAEEAKKLLSNWQSDLSRLHTEHNVIGERIEAIQNLVVSLTSKLSSRENLSLIGSSDNQPMVPHISASKKKAPQGENLRIIEEYLTSSGPQKSAEIAKAVNKGISSVYAVLKGARGRLKFKQDSKGAWSLI